MAEPDVWRCAHCLEELAAYVDEQLAEFDGLGGLAARDVEIVYGQRQMLAAALRKTQKVLNG